MSDIAVTRPILPSADLDATAAFYAPLGFDVVGRWPDEYLIITGPDAIELHFWHKVGVDRWTNDGRPSGRLSAGLPARRADP